MGIRFWVFFSSFFIQLDNDHENGLEASSTRDFLVSKTNFMDGLIPWRYKICPIIDQNTIMENAHCTCSPFEAITYRHHMKVIPTSIKYYPLYVVRIFYGNVIYWVYTAFIAFALNARNRFRLNGETVLCLGLKGPNDLFVFYSLSHLCVLAEMKSCQAPVTHSK